MRRLLTYDEIKARREAGVMEGPKNPLIGDDVIYTCRNEGTFAAKVTQGPFMVDENNRLAANLIVFKPNTSPSPATSVSYGMPQDWSAWYERIEADE